MGGGVGKLFCAGRLALSGGKLGIIGFSSGGFELGDGAGTFVTPPNYCCKLYISSHTMME